ncbi:MAG: threonine ammonia-lyase, biosynthetic [Gammaproteobacteria bacterium]
MFDEYKELIRAAGERVYTVACKTALDAAPALSKRLDNNIWLKREDQQPVFSYKLRGAYNLIASLSADVASKGVIAASAGNHAQGVALSAQRLGLQATIVMPKTTPEIKVAAVRRLGAHTIMHGNTYDEAREHAHKLAEESGQAFIPPYDHPLVIAGQATVGVEILEQHASGPDIIFVPVGGGGLIAGIAAHIKAIRPDIRIIGVEPDEAPCMHAALAAGERVRLERIGIFADGAAVRQAGEEPFRIARETVDEILLVGIDEICAAVKDIFEDTRSIAEPAGALALAGLKQYVEREQIKGKELVAIFSGANVNFDRLRHIAELAQLGEHREALICATIPERPGSFREFCQALGPRQITEFNYRYADHSTARVFAGVQLRHGVEEKDKLIANLVEKGFAVVDLSRNELAKMHVRHMVGGHAPQAENELLFRFEFPERSGALLNFLTQTGTRWNISLFHYRNHGAAYGRVLMGIQVRPNERPEFMAFLESLGMLYWEETDNPAYSLFLS